MQKTKMRINRFIMVGLVATSLLVSCKKENNTGGNASKDGFVAIMEQTDNADNGGRSHINPENWDNNSNWGVLWTTNDLIKIKNAEGTVQNYKLTQGANTTSGTFHTDEPNDSFLESSNFTAIYPDANEAGVANTISGTTATFTLPATQTYKENSFAEKSMPMVAYSTSQTLNFKNVLGGICFPMVGTGFNVTRIVLTSNNTNDKLWGVFNADCTSDDPMPSYTSDGDNTITLDCSANGGVNLGNNPTYFCIMVPPGTLQEGFTLKAYNGESIIFKKSTTSAMPENFIKRSFIRKVNNNLKVSIDITVGPGKKVVVAPGNLQWSASDTHNTADGTGAGTFRFAPHQWEYIGNDNVNVSETYTGWIDLLSWATSGWHNTADTYNIYYQPWSHTAIEDVVNATYNWYGYGPSTNMTDPNLVGTSLYYDWGQYNDIYNPSTQSTDPFGTWRVFTETEWDYMIDNRVTESGIRFAKATVHGVPGLLLVPDTWFPENYTLNSYNEPTASFDSNVISDADWEKLENGGCTFLPAAGYRNCFKTGEGVLYTELDQVGEYGYYWSSTHIDSKLAFRHYFSNENMSTNDDNYMGNRYRGESIRLVRDIE